MLTVADMGFLSFQYESASALLDFLSVDLGVLSNVISEMRGLGDGTGLMRAVCKYADENDMTVFLYVDADEELEDALKQDQLISFYEKFGFKLQSAPPDMTPKMARAPWREVFGEWSYPEVQLSKGETNDEPRVQLLRGEAQGAGTVLNDEWAGK